MTAIGTSNLVFDTMCLFHSELTTISDNNGLHRLVSSATGVVLNGIKHIASTSNLAKDTMFAIEMRSCSEAEEEL